MGFSLGLGKVGLDAYLSLPCLDLATAFIIQFEFNKVSLLKPNHIVRLIFHRGGGGVLALYAPRIKN